MGEKKLDVPSFLFLEGVAELAHCSTRYVKEEVKRGELRAYKPGKRLLFDPDDVQKWIKKKAVS